MVHGLMQTHDIMWNMFPIPKLIRMRPYMNFNFITYLESSRTDSEAEISVFYTDYLLSNTKCGILFRNMFSYNHTTCCLCRTSDIFSPFPDYRNVITLIKPVVEETR